MKIQWRMIWRSKHQVSDQIEEYSVFWKTGYSDFQSMCSVTICSAKPSSAIPGGPVSETEGSEISRTSDDTSETLMIDPDDWTPLVRYLENPGHIADSAKL
jgi:hypothetical protein